MQYKVSFILKVVYFIVKSLVRSTFKVFFRKKYLINEAGYDIDGPFILVSNHPSTLTDVMNAAKQYDGYIHFLANAGMFKNKFFGGFLKNTFAIPIERPVDVGGRKIDNEASFKYCYEHLGKGGNLYIAAEGGSKLTRGIRKLKTGTARIALKSESLHDFGLNIQILPVGVSYTAPKRFRSDFMLNVGEPILVKNYKEAYEEDAFQASRKITDDMAIAMKKLVLHTDEADNDVDKMVRILEHIHQSDNKETIKSQFPKSKQWIEKLVMMKHEENGKFEKIKNKVLGFCNSLSEEKLKEQDLKAQPLLLDIFLLIVGFIPAAFGYLNNFLFHHVPRFILKKTKLYPGYTSTVYLLFGLVFLPIVYVILFFVVKMVSGSALMAWIYLLLAFLLGFFAAHYFRYFGRSLDKRRMRKFRKADPTKYQSLKEDRKEIVDFIHTLF